ncbi:Eisosome component PIL1-domain-containing protein [Kalaharituber pfeilii]|nr:Eisosome component PIL1-domain-containing protein [Kalaharituber pfeilii]
MPSINPPPAYTPRTIPSQNNSSTMSSGRNRSFSLRGSKSRSVSTSSTGSRRGFFSSLKGGPDQPQLSKRLYRLIKSENHVINAYENAGRERINVATQLSEWGEQCGDDTISDLSDKLGVLLSEIGTQEMMHAQSLEDYRVILKAIRNTEASVQPSRDNKARIQEEIARLKYKDPQSSRIMQLEQELVRAEAENLVAEAQLINMTRSKLKEAYAQHFAVVIERCEKQAIIAKQGRKLLNLLDDTPIMPGSKPAPYDKEREARVILKEAEDAIKDWTENFEEVTSQVAHPAFLSKAGLPVPIPPTLQQTPPPEDDLEVHPAFRSKGKGKAPESSVRDRRQVAVV